MWQVEDGVRQRYVKRMMSKPGCDMTQDIGKKIWSFVSYDARAQARGQQGQVGRAPQEADRGIQGQAPLGLVKEYPFQASPCRTCNSTRAPWPWNPLEFHVIIRKL